MIVFLDSFQCLRIVCSPNLSQLPAVSQRAFNLQETEEILTQLRMVLHITDEVHMVRASSHVM